jgi:iron complex transport system substrate-binding protein
MEFRILIFLLFTVTSCVQHENEEMIADVQEIPHEQLEVRYAKGFTIEYFAQYTKILTKSIAGNTFFEDSVFLVHQKEHQLSKGSKVVPTELNSVCCQSSTHLAYMDQLNVLDAVKGLCGLKYIQQSEINQRLGEVQEICLGEASQAEDILAISPDIYLVYPFASEELSSLQNQGVKTLMVAEYLEEHPVARLEWIKLYGVLFHQEELAKEYFESVEKVYFDLVKEPDTNKMFFLNLPFGDSWYTPSANSLIVRLMEDAGLDYYYKAETGTENTPHSQEEMWETGTIANYWVIIADRPENFSLNDLIAENEVYANFKSVVHQQVIFCNTRTADYFVQGVVEPDIMLKDILYATHQLSEHQPKYFHLLK